MDQAKILTLVIIGISSIMVWLPIVGKALNHAVTLIHELGHAIASLLLGGGVKAVRIEPDGSGSTVSTQQLKFGYVFNRLVVLLSGYSFPLYLGAVLIILAFLNNIINVWVLVGLSVIALIFIRNFFGLLIVICFAGLASLGLIIPNFPLYIIPAFLGAIFLIGGIKDIADISKVVWNNKTTSSDFNFMEDETHITSKFWVIFFYIYNSLIISGLFFMIFVVEDLAPCGLG